MSQTTQQTPPLETAPTLDPPQPDTSTSATETKESQTKASTLEPDTTKATESADPNAAATTETAEEKVGDDPFAEEKKDGTPASEYLGVPEDGKYTYTLPDGFAPDEAKATAFTEMAKDLGLSPKGAQKVLDKYVEEKKEEAKQWDQHLISLDKAARADPDIGGAKYPEAVRQAKSALAKFAPKDFTTTMSKYGVTRHPAFIKAWAAVGAALGETPLPGLGAGSAATAEPMLHDLMYKDNK